MLFRSVSMSIHEFLITAVVPIISDFPNVTQMIYVNKTNELNTQDISDGCVRSQDQLAYFRQIFPSFRTFINTHSNLFPHQTEKEWPTSAEQPYSDKTRCAASASFVNTMCGAPNTRNERSCRDSCLTAE